MRGSALSLISDILCLLLSGLHLCVRSLSQLCFLLVVGSITCLVVLELVIFKLVALISMGVGLRASVTVETISLRVVETVLPHAKSHVNYCSYLSIVFVQS